MCYEANAVMCAGVELEQGRQLVGSSAGNRCVEAKSGLEKAQSSGEIRCQIIALPLSKECTRICEMDSFGNYGYAVKNMGMGDERKIFYPSGALLASASLVCLPFRCSVRYTGFLSSSRVLLYYCQLSWIRFQSLFGERVY